MLIVEPRVEFVQMSQHPSDLVEDAARTCYKSIGDGTLVGTQDFIRRIVRRGHESVLEHASVTLRIICDRGVSHQIVRHRHFSFSQESTQFCNYAKERFGTEITVIEPPGLDSVTKSHWLLACKQAEESYFALKQAKVKNDIARSVLPTCLKTEIVVTSNLRGWRNFLKVRLLSNNEVQMIQIAKMVLAIFRIRLPLYVEDIKNVQ